MEYGWAANFVKASQVRSFDLAVKERQEVFLLALQNDRGLRQGSYRRPL